LGVEIYLHFSDIEGCGKDAFRSVSVVNAKAAGLEVKGRRAYLCEQRYRFDEEDAEKGSAVQRVASLCLADELWTTLKLLRK